VWELPVDKETEGHTTLGWLNFTVFQVIGLAPFWKFTHL